MPILFEYNPEKNIYYLTIIKNFSTDEFDGILKKITQADHYPSDSGVLLDASSLNVPIGDLQFNRDITEIRKRFLSRGKGKTAIITSSDFTFGMGGKYEMLSEGMPENIMIFDNFIEAEGWLENV
jgi:hypothetical protein